MARTNSRWSRWTLKEIIAGVRYYSEPIAEKAEYAAPVENR